MGRQYRVYGGLRFRFTRSEAGWAFETLVP
jgi:hypothetical protein